MGHFTHISLCLLADPSFPPPPPPLSSLLARRVLEGDLEISEGQLDDAQAAVEKEKAAR